VKSPKIPKILIGNPKKQICNRLSTANQGGQNNRAMEK
jgi:hypothetical protein